MPLFRTVFDTKGFYFFFIPNGFYPERFLIRTVLIPKGRFSEIWNKNLSDQEPFGSKNLMILKKILLNFMLFAGVKWTHGTEE